MLVKPNTAIAEEPIEVLVIQGKQSASHFTTNQITNDQQQFRIGLIDVSDVLTEIPGLQVDSRSNFAQDTRLSLRGFGARSAFGIRGIDLLVDGIPISTPDGQGQLSSVPLDRIKQVQVISGPVAAIYGNSPGGVISFVSKKPEATSANLQFNQSNQNYEQASVGFDWQKDQFALASQFNRTRFDPERPHSNIEREQASLALYYTSTNDWNWIVKFDQSHDPLLEDPLGLTPQQFEEDPFQENTAAINFNTRKNINNKQASISLRKDSGDKRWQVGLWQSDRSITQYLGFSGDASTSAGGVIDLNRKVMGINSTFTEDFSWFNREWQWSLGAEITQMQDDRQGFVNLSGTKGDLRRDETGEVSNRDIYSILQFKPTEDVKTYISFRQSYLDFSVDDYFIRSNNNVIINPDDSGDKNFSENAFAMGVEYSFAEDWVMFSSLGKGYETPTLTEMAYSNNATGLNIALGASRNQQLEWGFKYDAPNWQWQVSQFYINTENEIVVDQSINGRTTYRNAQETQRQGIELLNRYEFNDYLSGSFSLQTLDAKFTQGQWQDNQLPGTAKNVYQANIRYTPFANEYLSINLGSTYRDKVATSDDNVISAPSWQTWDLSFDGMTHWKSINWWCRITNLTDKKYVGSVIVNQSNGRAFEPGLGRQIMLGVKFKLL